MRLLQGVYSNLWGSYDLAFIGSNCYFVVIINNNSRKI